MSVRLSSAERGSERLAARRRRSRRRAFIALCLFALLSLGALIYGLWQPAVRINRVDVQGTDVSPLETIAREALQGGYLGVIPRDSIFFFPASRIRNTILATHTDIAAVSISRSGFSGISIKTDMRVPIARWCGSSSLPPSPEDSPLKEVVPTASGDCYLFDASGFVYATATEAFFTVGGVSPAVGSNSDKTLTPFVLFSALQSGTVIPVGATLKDANRLSAIFDFARQLGLSGPPVRAVVIRDDEADFFLATSTYGAATGPRITYLLGDEQDAFTALVSAKGTLNLSDPFLQYVDLRFPGKVYLKKKE